MSELEVPNNWTREFLLEELGRERTNRMKLVEREVAAYAARVRQEIEEKLLKRMQFVTNVIESTIREREIKAALVIVAEVLGGENEQE